MYILRNYIYTGTIGNRKSILHNHNAVRVSLWSIMKNGDYYFDVCDIGFESEEEAIIFKLKFNDMFI